MVLNAWEISNLIRRLPIPGAPGPPRLPRDSLVRCPRLARPCGRWRSWRRSEGKELKLTAAARRQLVFFPRSWSWWTWCKAWDPPWALWTWELDTGGKLGCFSACLPGIIIGHFGTIAGWIIMAFVDTYLDHPTTKLTAGFTFRQTTEIPSTSHPYSTSTETTTLTVSRVGGVGEGKSEGEGFLRRIDLRVGFDSHHILVAGCSSDLLVVPAFKGIWNLWSCVSQPSWFG